MWYYLELVLGLVAATPSIPASYPFPAQHLSDDDLGVSGGGRRRMWRWWRSKQSLRRRRLRPRRRLRKVSAQRPLLRVQRGRSCGSYSSRSPSPLWLSMPTCSWKEFFTPLACATCLKLPCCGCYGHAVHDKASTASALDNQKCLQTCSEQSAARRLHPVPRTNPYD